MFICDNISEIPSLISPLSAELGNAINRSTRLESFLIGSVDGWIDNLISEAALYSKAKFQFAFLGEDVCLGRSVCSYQQLKSLMGRGVSFQTLMLGLTPNSDKRLQGLGLKKSPMKTIVLEIGLVEADYDIFNTLKTVLCLLPRCVTHIIVHPTLLREDRPSPNICDVLPALASVASKDPQFIIKHCVLENDLASDGPCEWDEWIANFIPNTLSVEYPFYLWSSEQSPLRKVSALSHLRHLSIHDSEASQKAATFEDIVSTLLLYWGSILMKSSVRLTS
jgi:hypothetical protein